MSSGPVVNATRARRLALVAVCVAIFSLAGFCIVSYSFSHRKNLPAIPMASLVELSTAAAYTALIGAPISLLFSILAIKARARCLNPRPKMPVVALYVSAPLVAGAILLIVFLLYLEGLGHMH